MAEERRSQQEISNSTTAFEPSDASIRGIVISGVVLGVVSVAIMLAMVRAFDLFAHHVGGMPGTETEMTTQEMRWPRLPRLEGLPAEPAERQTSIDASHAGYGWIDREHQIARVTIEEAMKMVVDKTRAPQIPEKRQADRRLDYERTHPPGPSGSGRVTSGE
jgi:hypothetical protein